MIETIVIPSSTCRDPFVVWQDDDKQWYWYLDIPFSDDHGPFETAKAAKVDVLGADADVEIGVAENNYRNWSIDNG